MEDTIFKKQIESILVDNRLKRYVGRQKTGKLEFRRLYRSAFTDKCFRKKEGEDGRQYNLLLFADFSGSMVHGGRIKPLGKMLPKLISSFQDLIDIEVIGFNCGFHPIKRTGKGNTFGEEMFDQKKLDDFLYYKAWQEVTPMGNVFAAGNHDGYWLAQAYNKYLRAKQGKKIIIVLSDGSPACDFGGKTGGCGLPGCGSYETRRKELKQTVGQIEKEGVPVIGIGIQTDSVKEFYTRHARVDDLTQMYVEIVKHLKTCVHKRMIG